MNINTFSNRLSNIQQSIMLWINDLLIKQPGVNYQIRYGVPFYRKNAWICYINPKKHDSLELVFIRGQELSNSEAILEVNNRKIVAGIRLYDVPNSELEKRINITLQEAILLDEVVPQKSKMPFGKQ